MADTPFGLKEAIDLYTNHRGAILQIWGFFSAATLAVLGFTLGSQTAARSRLETLCIQIGYFVFTVGNGYVLYGSQGELERLAHLVNQLAPENIAAALAFDPTPAFGFVVFQVIICLGVLAAVEATHHTRR